MVELESGAADQDQERSDSDVDQRPGDGDEEFFARLFRNALEPRYAADRQQDHVGRRHAESARCEYVAELVQQHTEEQQQEEYQSDPGFLRSAGDVAHAEKPGEKQHECHMDADRCAGDGPDIQRPAHGNLRAPQALTAGWLSNDLDA